MKRLVEINHDTGATNFKLRFRRQEPIQIRLNTRRAKHFAGYKLIHKDLRDAKIWLEEAVALFKAQNKRVLLNDAANNDIVIKGLFKITVINYRKAFDRGEGRFVKLDDNVVPDHLRVLHDELRTIRHTYAAHGGVSNLEKLTVTFALAPRKYFNRGKLHSQIGTLCFKQRYRNMTAF